MQGTIVTAVNDAYERRNGGDMQFVSLLEELIVTFGKEEAVDRIGIQISGCYYGVQYNDSISRRLVNKVAIFDKKIMVELKSSLILEVGA